MDWHQPRLARVSELTLRATGAFLSLAFACLWHCTAQAQDGPRRVLMLSGYNYTLPSATTVAEAIRNRLLERASRAVEVDAEFLDLARSSSTEHEIRFVNFLRDRYAGGQPHVVVPVGREALRFTMKHRNSFAPGVPVVFAAVQEDVVSSLQLPPGITGTTTSSELNLIRTLDLAERLQPHARHLIVVAGSSPADRVWHPIARRVVEGRERKFDARYLFEHSFAELIAAVSQAPTNAIVIFLSFFADSTGKTFIPAEAGAALASHSSAPTYTPYVNIVGKIGAIGGSSQPLEVVGSAAADIALDVIGGKDPSSIAPAAGPSSYRADYRAMQRFGLSESKLPPGTTLLFREPTIWEQHRHFVLAVVGIIALQSVAAGALLLERRSRRRTERLLAESEERMTFTAATANIGLWQFDPETNELWTTEHCRSMFGLGPDVPLTRTLFLEVIHPEDRAAAIAALRQATNSDQLSGNDIRVVWPDQQVRWIRIVARSHQDHQQSKQLSGTFIDVSDQKAAQVEAALQQREVTHLTRVSVLGELSGAIAHEINQPLTAILSNAQAALHLLPENAPNVAEIREALNDIVNEDNRAGQVIQKLRSLLKKGETTFEPIGLNELVNSTVALLNSELISRGVTVQVVLANDLPPTLGDPVQLQQVLINLLINAIDAMAATPAAQRLITVTTRTRSGAAEIVVRDRGTGVAALEQPMLFEPFYTTKQHGLGLGLTICSSIIKAHGGELSLTNNPGGGADARFALPAQELLIAAQ